MGPSKRLAEPKLDYYKQLTGYDMTDTPKQEVTVKCDNNETQANEAPQVESQSVSVTVTGFSLFATTLK